MKLLDHNLLAKYRISNHGLKMLLNALDCLVNFKTPKILKFDKVTVSFRELESVIAQRNLLTSRTRRRVLDDLATAASQSDDSHVSLFIAAAYSCRSSVT